MFTKAGYAQIQSILAAIYQNRPLILVPYAYPVQIAAAGMATATTQNLSLNITGNADFLCTGINYRAVLAASQSVSSKTAALVRMLVTDAGSNQKWTDGAVDLENYCANGGYERGLPWPRLVRGRSTLQITLTNYSSASVGVAETYTSLDLLFEGLLVYVPAQQ